MGVERSHPRRQLLAGSHPRLKARVLLLDVDLPGLNGLGVLRRLAHDGVLQHPVLSC